MSLSWSGGINAPGDWPTHTNIDHHIHIIDHKLVCTVWSLTTHSTSSKICSKWEGTSFQQGVTDRKHWKEDSFLLGSMVLYHSELMLKSPLKYEPEHSNSKDTVLWPTYICVLRTWPWCVECKNFIFLLTPFTHTKSPCKSSLVVLSKW